MKSELSWLFLWQEDKRKPGMLTFLWKSERHEKKRKTEQSTQTWKGYNRKLNCFTIRAPGEIHSWQLCFPLLSLNFKKQICFWKLSPKSIIKPVITLKLVGFAKKNSESTVSEWGKKKINERTSVLCIHLVWGKNSHTDAKTLLSEAYYILIILSLDYMLTLTFKTILFKTVL